MYTAQGDLVCDKQLQPAREMFVQEKPNMSPPSSQDTELVKNALDQEYCDISVTTDPKTGQILYSFKKECSGAKKAAT